MNLISKQEAKLIYYFNQKNQPCFTNSQAKTAYPALSNNNVEKLLSHMAYKGLLMRIKEGLYYIIPYEQEANTFMPDWHLIVPYLVKDEHYYIGYCAALQIYGLNTQPSLKEQVVVNQQIRPTILSIKGIPFQFIYHNSKHFFGYQPTWIDAFHQVNCSDIEKTIIDSLFKPSYAGGIIEIAKALHLVKDELNMSKLFTYTQQFQSQAVIKRLGFLLELLNVNTPILEELQKVKSSSVVLLDPEAPPIGKIVTRWSIQKNIDSVTIQSAIYT
jgi:predicted transcriptional regulator of viral defense system